MRYVSDDYDFSHYYRTTGAEGAEDQRQLVGARCVRPHAAVRIVVCGAEGRADARVGLEWQGLKC